MEGVTQQRVRLPELVHYLGHAVKVFTTSINRVERREYMGEPNPIQLLSSKDLAQSQRVLRLKEVAPRLDPIVGASVDTELLGQLDDLQVCVVAQAPQRAAKRQSHWVECPS